MSKNYLIYPCKTMRITQTYNGKTSHYGHTAGFPKDYPIDEGCENTGKSYMYCPCDEMIIKRIYGVGNKGVNTIWLESSDKVFFADGTENYVTFMITHPDDAYLKKMYVGQKFSRKEKICPEGKDGANGNHFHFSAGKGKFKGNGWIKNSKNKWILNVTVKTEKPEKLFFIDPDFTKIKSSQGLKFSTLPKQYEKGNYRVTANLLNVRTGPGTEYEKKSYAQLSVDAQRKIISLVGYEANGYVKELTFSALDINENWGRTPSGWVCLDYCEVL